MIKEHKEVHVAFGKRHNPDTFLLMNRVTHAMMTKMVDPVEIHEFIEKFTQCETYDEALEFCNSVVSIDYT